MDGGLAVENFFPKMATRYWEGSAGFLQNETLTLVCMMPEEDANTKFSMVLFLDFPTLISRRFANALNSSVDMELRVARVTAATKELEKSISEDALDFAGFFVPTLITVVMLAFLIMGAELIFICFP